VAHGKPPQFAILNHAAVDSGIPRVSHSEDWYYPASSVYDISRARAELGYAPQYDLERGIADYLESLERLKAS